MEKLSNFLNVTQRTNIKTGLWTQAVWIPGPHYSSHVILRSVRPLSAHSLLQKASAAADPKFHWLSVKGQWTVHYCLVPGWFSLYFFFKKVIFMYWFIFFFRLLSEAWGILVPWAGVELMHSILGARSFNQGSTRQVVAFLAMSAQPPRAWKEGEKPSQSNAKSKIMSLGDFGFAFYLVSAGLL